MYIPTAFNEPDRQVLLRFIASNPFATLVTPAAAAARVSHIPMYLLEENGKDFLVGHLARANDHWEHLDGSSVAVFAGPHAYISPRWYGTGNVVPTWNYVAVHVSGPVAVTDSVELGVILDRMIKVHEPDPAAFHAGLDASVRSSLEGHIVGIRMEIGSLEGKWKLSQNKSRETRAKLAGGLEATGDWNARQVAALMAAVVGPTNQDNMAGSTPPGRP